MLFFDPTSNWPFPIFSQSARFYHHPVAQALNGRGTWAVMGRERPILFVLRRLRR